MKRIRQGHTRWQTVPELGPDGRIEGVWVVTMFVVWSIGGIVNCGYDVGIITTEEWRGLHKTRRAAWRAAWAMVQETDRRRDAEYAAAWVEA